MESDRIRLRLYLFVFAGLLLVGSIGFMYVENLSLVDSIYFAIATMATVGYGDIHPQSNVGKILALILIFGGVGTFLGVVASITEVFLKRREELFRQEKLNMDISFHWRCGLTLLIQNQPQLLEVREVDDIDVILFASFNGVATNKNRAWSFDTKVWNFEA